MNIQTVPLSRRVMRRSLRMIAPFTLSRAGGGWLRRLGILLLLLLMAGAGYLAAVNALRFSASSYAASDWLAVPDIMKNRPEVRIVRPVIESGRSADATVVATGYLESRRQAKIGATHTRSHSRRCIGRGGKSR